MLVPQSEPISFQLVGCDIFVSRFQPWICQGRLLNMDAAVMSQENKIPHRIGAGYMLLLMQGQGYKTLLMRGVDEICMCRKHVWFVHDPS